MDLLDGFIPGPRRQERSLESSDGAEKWLSLPFEEAQKIVGEFFHERRGAVARKVLLDGPFEKTSVLQDSRNQRALRGNLKCPPPNSNFAHHDDARRARGLREVRISRRRATRFYEVQQAALIGFESDHEIALRMRESSAAIAS